MDSGARDSVATYAVLHTDVVGSTAVLADYPHTGAHRIQADIDEMERIARLWGGELERDTGDGAVLLFPSAGNAYRAAVEIQDVILARNARRRASEPLVEHRIGAHFGEVDVVAADGGPHRTKRTGNTIVIAARLQSACGPGEVRMSHEFYTRAVADGARIAAGDLGTMVYKSEELPIRAWETHRNALTLGAVRETLRMKRKREELKRQQEWEVRRLEQVAVRRFALKWGTGLALVAVIAVSVLALMQGLQRDHWSGEPAPEAKVAIVPPTEAPATPAEPPAEKPKAKPNQRKVANEPFHEDGLPPIPRDPVASIRDAAPADPAPMKVEVLPDSDEPRASSANAGAPGQGVEGRTEDGV